MKVTMNVRGRWAFVGIVATVLVGCSSTPIPPSIRAQVALRSVTNQMVLAQFALDGSDPDIAKAAVEKLTDQSLLAKVAMKERCSDLVRKIAFDKVNDQGVLVQMASHGTDMLFAKAAVAKLTDQAALAKVALEGRDWYVAKAAAEKVNQQTLLANIVTKHEDYRVRYAALQNVTDQPLLLKIVRDYDTPHCRTTQDEFLQAVASLTDRAALSYFAEHGDFTLHVDQIARLRLFLTDPLNEKRLGVTKVVVSIRTGSKDYVPENQRNDSQDLYHLQKHIGMTGECIEVRVSGGKLNREVAAVWATTFPKFAKAAQSEVSLGFKRANVDIQDLISLLAAAVQETSPPVNGNP